MPKLQVFSNIPTPYNSDLYTSLRHRGHGVSVTYHSTPADQGRAWAHHESRDERIVHGSLASAKAAWAARRSDAVLLSGGYRALPEVARSVALIGSCRRLFWGERLLPTETTGQFARRLAFAPFQAVLAVGTWAQPGYANVVRSSVPIHIFPYTTSAERPVRANLNRTPTCGFVGSLIPRKGLDVVITALARLEVRARPVLEVVGTGAAEATLRAQAEAEGVRVNWLGQLTKLQIAQRQLTWYFQVVPSRYDGWGVVVSEALASGLPVLASDAVGAALDLVRPHVNGQIVSAEGDWSNFLSLYTDPELALAQGAAARRVGVAASAERAAAWLPRVLHDEEPRSFIADAWAAC